MRRQLSAAAVLTFALVSPALAGPRDGEDKKEVKDALPREATVEWDVRVFEDGPTFTPVKREVKGSKVTWVLENKRNLGTEITFGYQASLFDEDGVKLAAIEIETEPFLLNMAKGDRNRFVLHLPQPEKWKVVRKVVITNGQFGR
ncbi:MAG TPA: hypothetical protein VKE40_09520 [Gemmataceae bacterium]|nr:hypothetical protein [Gemmataceae bacterium]